MGIFDIFKKSRPRSGSRQRSGKVIVGAKRKQVEPTLPAGRQVKRAPIKKKEGAAFRLLKEPHISEKATNLSEAGKYVFKVFPQANKSEIKRAVENIYGVAVKKVNIINIKTKKRILKGREGKKSGYKKAVVTLERGHKIEILPH